MPRIPEYVAPQAERGIAIPQTGHEALERAANTAMRFGEEERRDADQLGEYAQNSYNEYQKHQTFDQISNGSAVWSKMYADRSEQWSDMMKSGDAADPQKVAAWNDQWHQQYDKWAGGFTTDSGQQFALRHRMDAEDHWTERVVADRSNLDAANAIRNLNTVHTHLSQATFNDPTSVNGALATWDATVDEMVKSSNMTGDQALKFRAAMDREKSTLATVGAASAIVHGNDPTKWRDVIGPDAVGAIDGGSQLKLDAHAGEVVRQNQAAARVAETEQRRQQSEAVDNRINQIYLSTFGNDGQQQVPQSAFAAAKQVALMPGVKPGQVHALVGYLEHLSTGVDKQTTQGTLDGIMTSMAKGVAPSQQQVFELMGSTDGPHLSREDGGFVLKLIKPGSNPQDRQFQTAMINSALNSATTLLHGGSYTPGGYNPGADASVARFKAWFYPTYEKGIAAGATPEELLTPESPKYLFKPENILRFKMTDDDVLKSAGGGPNAVPSSSAPVGAPAPGGSVGAPAARPPLRSFFGGGGATPAALVPATGAGTTPAVQGTAASAPTPAALVPATGAGTTPAVQGTAASAPTPEEQKKFYQQPGAT